MLTVKNHFFDLIIDMLLGRPFVVKSVGFWEDNPILEKYACRTIISTIISYKNHRRGVNTSFY